MITGFAAIKGAVQAIKMGALDYIKKPIDFEELLALVERAINISSLKEENQSLKSTIASLSPKIITKNSHMIEVIQKARKLAQTDLPVLIYGENGTGKELLADFIHIESSRRSQRMLKANCAAFTESLLDNELFGHEKGSYTGADSTVRGLFERAHHGTLFLDEIGDMSLPLQAKVLRVIQNQEVRRIGSNDTITLDIRFVAATNMNLNYLIGQNRFREDLLFRLNTAVLNLPPLRERKEDIPLLVECFLNDSSRCCPQASDHLVKKFLEYDWPGNIRELKNVVNYAVAMCTRNAIGLEDLPPTFGNPYPEARVTKIRDRVERDLILSILASSHLNKKEAATKMNMSRSTLYAKMRKYGLLGQ
jgi:DNA-binding NtrC family response regulator